MNDPNSQFHSDYHGNNSQRDDDYTYEFSSENDTSRHPQKAPQRGSGVRVAVFVLALLFTVAFSFAAGFAGSYVANMMNVGASNSNVNAAPNASDLLRDDPENIINKSESQGSFYGSAGEDVFSVSQVVSRVHDAVVIIDTANGGSGSGVIISADGYILTCHHVVDGASALQVTLNSGSKFEASLVGSDADSDLAVIRIQPIETEPLTYAEQGCSADLVVGEVVVAIGNPLGTLGGTVTDGIISATERNIQTSDGTSMTLLQTNAAINSGNSGGGLFNLDGKLIGIVNAKYASAGVEGLAFAIPIDSAYNVQLDLIEFGYVRGIVDHGISTLDVTEANLMQYYFRYGISVQGVYVLQSDYNSDIKNGDRIVSVNGVEVKTTSDIKGVLKDAQIGDTISIVYERSGKIKTTQIVLREYVPDSLKKLG